MGGDGGSIPGRADIVKTAGYRFVRNLGGMGYAPNTQTRIADEKFGKNEVRNLRWTTCAISQEKLKSPVVMCRLGNLYNKESILTGLLNKSLPPHTKHIRTMKDVKECKAQVNKNTGFWICPISLVDLEGGVRAIGLWTCGCIISEKAMKNVGSKTEKSKKCVICGTTYEDNDIISLIPDESTLRNLKEKLEKVHSLKLKERETKRRKKL